MRPLSNFLPSKSSSRHAFHGSHLRLLSRRVFAKSLLRPSSVFFFLSFSTRENESSNGLVKSACCPLSRGIDASVARGYAKQLSWNAVSCSETRVDVMRLTRARILAGSYARALRLRDSTKLHTLLSHPMNLFFFFRSLLHFLAVRLFVSSRFV